jgi:hypothetical protein
VVGSLAWAGDQPELRLKRQVELKRGPSKDAETLGVLPVNTIAGDQQGKTGEYKLISVELADGQLLDGWVPVDSVEPLRRRRPAEEDDAAPKKKDKIYVPPDEAILLRRNPTFTYGVQAGGNFSMIQTSISTGYSNGLGFMGGGYVGFFLDPNIPVRIEGNVLQANGALDYSAVAGAATTSTATTQSYGFNFFEIGIVPALRTGDFEFFAGLTYQFGLGLGFVPTGITLNSASDLSSLGIEAGAGYRLKLSNETYLGLRLRYQTNFQRSPFAFNNIGFVVALEFEG